MPFSESEFIVLDLYEIMVHWIIEFAQDIGFFEFIQII